MEIAKIVIIEDEFIVAEDISMQLRNIGYEVPAVYSSGEEAYPDILKILPDIVLIDINLGAGMDGISLAGKITEQLPVPIIFVTAYSDRTIIDRAKSVKPHAYIVKPFSFINLLTSIELALSNFENKKFAASPEEFENPIITDKSSGYVIYNFFFIKNGQKFEKIGLKEILYLEASGSYCHVFTRNKKFTLSNNLHTILDKFAYSNIIRTHRSYAVNMDHVDGFIDSSLIVKDKNIPVSKQYREDVLRKIPFA